MCRSVTRREILTRELQQYGTRAGEAELDWRNIACVIDAQCGTQTREAEPGARREWCDMRETERCGVQTGEAKPRGGSRAVPRAGSETVRRSGMAHWRALLLRLHVAHDGAFEVAEKKRMPQVGFDERAHHVCFHAHTVRTPHVGHHLVANA